MRTLALKNHDKTRCGGSLGTLINENVGKCQGTGVFFCLSKWIPQGWYKKHDRPEAGQGSF
ncbi:MAG: hypothetical protein A2309_08055 [Bacteroidetes bacterium RIFOXYB2_FULL_35_7]|nr:MAG: hypothetical protein A2X01_11280 [Bacteroidetes bacterium GWF2_35_48]OFY96578.1 MAG: hypothetical protein A2309_08055 [Bacteroidetes bacterium RIFOXYB2_FULL_35_7]HBX51344.1 hypothetical protein [Bacteroidales bacterium]